MVKKILGLFMAVFAFAYVADAQVSITGKVVDATGNPIENATIQVQGTNIATISATDGSFSIQAPGNTGKLLISYVNAKTRTVSFNGTTDLGNIELDENQDALDEVVVVGRGVIDLAKDRNTPIAVSTIKGQAIQDQVGLGDVSQALVNTPSVYVAGQSGGYGDSRINLRGFGQDNTAYLLNGQPINGMEDGLMYWSNWSGMSDIANAIQVQRGLGSSKLAISSVGGTVNFVTKATELKEGGFVSFGTGSNKYYKGTVAYNSGLSASGWGVSVMLTHWQGDGYMDGTKGQGQNYFLSVGYKPNEKHQFNFLVTGAPQWHDQAFRDNISDYLTYGRKYNSNWGYLNGDYYSERRNFYHKPVANFNWDFDINSSTSLSTVVYASWGRGGGTGSYGRLPESVSKYTDGQIDFDNIYANNQAAADGVGSYGNYNYLTRSSMNNHAWYGVVSNLGKKLSEHLNLNVGMDLRTYKGTHYRQVADFLGLDAWDETWNLKGADHQGGAGSMDKHITESLAADPWKSFFKTLPQDQRIDYDYTENISYGGVFGQLEYSTSNFSAFFQGAASTQSHIRRDFEYVDAYQKSDKVNNLGYNLKGGVSYKFDPKNVVYFNTGYYSRQPYHDNIYLNFTNEVNPLTENEKIFGLELGYSYTSNIFSASLNLYRTSWKDRVETTSRLADADEVIGGISVPEGSVLYSSNQGVEQLHSGIEFDFVLRPTYALDINGFVSLGNWEYKGDAIVTTRNEDLETLAVEETDLDGGKVGDAAQTTLGLGARYKIVKGLSLDANWRYYDNLYSNVVTKDNIKLPTYDVMDAGLAYLLNLNGRKSLRFRVGVNNLFDEIYLSEMSTANAADADASKNYKGVNISNQVYFGWGRTWNASIRFNF
ncbi:TonB-dependent receptor [Niabella terrae]